MTDRRKVIQYPPMQLCCNGGQKTTTFKQETMGCLTLLCFDMVKVVLHRYLRIAFMFNGGQLPVLTTQNV